MNPADISLTPRYNNAPQQPPVYQPDRLRPFTSIMDTNRNKDYEPLKRPRVKKEEPEEYEELIENAPQQPQVYQPDRLRPFTSIMDANRNKDYVPLKRPHVKKEEPEEYEELIEDVDEEEEKEVPKRPFVPYPVVPYSMPVWNSSPEKELKQKSRSPISTSRADRARQRHMKRSSSPVQFSPDREERPIEEKLQRRSVFPYKFTVYLALFNAKRPVSPDWQYLFVAKYFPYTRGGSWQNSIREQPTKHKALFMKVDADGNEQFEKAKKGETFYTIRPGSEALFRQQLEDWMKKGMTVNDMGMANTADWPKILRGQMGDPTDEVTYEPSAKRSRYAQDELDRATNSVQNQEEEDYEEEYNDQPMPLVQSQPLSNHQNFFRQEYAPCNAYVAQPAPRHHPFNMENLLFDNYNNQYNQNEWRNENQEYQEDEFFRL